MAKVEILYPFPIVRESKALYCSLKTHNGVVKLEISNGETAIEYIGPFTVNNSKLYTSSC